MTNTDQPLGLRERKRQETHRKLAGIALRLIAERGLDQVTVEDIAGEAGVSSRTFFNYFGTKEEAITSPHPDQRARREAAMARLTALSPGPWPLLTFIQALRPDLERMDTEREEWMLRMTVFGRHPQLIATSAVLAAEDEKGLAQALADWLGLPVTDQYPTLLMHTASAAMRSALTRWYAVDGAESVVDIVDATCAALTSGLPLPADATPRG